jgi:DNA-binding XRE family transcriptional regulator
VANRSRSGDDDNTEQESLGLLLSKCRRRKGLSQQQVANLLGYAREEH